MTSPQEPKKPISPTELHNFEDREAFWQDKDRWDTTDYAYPTGWDTAFLDMDEDDIDALQRYAG